MTAPTKPGQRCRVIGGSAPFNGEGESPNKNKEVVTMFLHDLKAGIEQENVWHCQGENIQTFYGVGSEADFLECWLEVIEPPGIVGRIMRAMEREA
jgi:hypothetical protein